MPNPSLGTMDTTDHEVVSVDGLHRVVVFRREDGTYGYREFKRQESGVSAWLALGQGHSRFGSAVGAMQEARQRIAWLKREVDWPARDLEPQAAEQYMPGWVECPRCRVRFSLHDPHRWGSGRHLTCGQRIQVKEFNDGQ